MSKLPSFSVIGEIPQEHLQCKKMSASVEYLRLMADYQNAQISANRFSRYAAEFLAEGYQMMAETTQHLAEIHRQECELLLTALNAMYVKPATTSRHTFLPKYLLK
jgi:hypothetical protein